MPLFWEPEKEACALSEGTALVALVALAGQGTKVRQQLE